MNNNNNKAKKIENLSEICTFLINTNLISMFFLQINMYRTQFVFILVVAYSFQPIITLPQGAPESVCHSLLPFHGGGIPPASSQPPYRIVPHNVAVNQGQILRVEIEPLIPELSFGGFMIHARNINPPYQVVSGKLSSKLEHSDMCA